MESLKIQRDLANSGMEITPEVSSQVDQAVQSGEYGNIGQLFTGAAQAQRQRKLEDRDYERQLKEREFELKQQEKEAQAALRQAQAGYYRDVGRAKETQAIAEASRPAPFKMPKESEFKAAGFAKRSRMAEASLSKLPSDVGTGIIENIDLIPNVFRTEERKQYENTKNNFISAVLRKESGAVISPEESAREEAKYFPQAGDDEKVLAQKRQLREQAIRNLEAEGQRALPLISDAPPIQNLETVAGTQQPVRVSTPAQIPMIPNAQAAPSMPNPALQQDPMYQRYMQLMQKRRGQ